MKMCIFVLALGLASFTSAAQADYHNLKRPNSLKLSCQQAKSVVKQNRLVILYTGRNIYQRVVTSGWYCNRDQYADWYYTKTRDKRSCQVGYYCRERDHDNDDFLFRRW